MWVVDDVPDSERKCYICKVPAERLSIPEPTSTPATSPRLTVACPAYSIIGPEDTCYMPGFPSNGYTKAKDDCARRGGILASVQNARTNDFLAASFSLLRDQKYWLGGMLNTSNDPYKWQWIDDSPFNYTNWAPGQEVNAALPGNPFNDALRVLFEASTGLWHATKYLSPSGNSGPEYASICVVVIASDVEHARCPVGAFAGPNDKCYLVGTEGRSWSDAEKQCNKQGGTIASIHDWGTNLAVLHILHMHSSQWYWIGASNRTGKWMWSDGNAFTFSNWGQDDIRHEGRSRPGNVRTITDGVACGSMGGVDGKWRFDTPDNRNPYICSVSPGFHRPTSTTVKSTSTSREVGQPSTLPGTDRRDITLPVTVGGATLALILALTGVSFFCCMRTKRRRDMRRLIEINHESCWTTEGGEQRGIMLSIGKGTWVVRDLQISTCILGSGAFADVYKAKLVSRPALTHVDLGPGLGEDAQRITDDVAVKMSRGALRQSQRDSLLREAELMYKIGGNGHILRLIGHALLNDQPILVLEYCAKGDLLTFLRKTLRTHKDDVATAKEDVQETPSRGTKISLAELISLCWQISDGMLYLSSKGYIHRDLAARNILLTSEMVAKIADFGLCRYSDEQLYTMQDETRLPVKWCAPEALSKAQFSTQSDVWSFGVLLYEIFSAGGVPYENVCPTNMLKHLNEGHRQEQPDLCPPDTYRLMLDCWHETPNERPTFESIRSYFAKCLEYLSKDYGYIIPSHMSEA